MEYGGLSTSRLPLGETHREAWTSEAFEILPLRNLNLSNSKSSRLYKSSSSSLRKTDITDIHLC